jgi:hypothetical protein
MAIIKIPIQSGDYKWTAADKLGAEFKIELRRGRAVPAALGSYLITGIAVPLNKRLKASPGIFAITGYDNRLMQWRLSLTDRGSYMIMPPRHFGTPARIYLGYAPGLFAFPSDTQQGIQMGLTLRQYYAAQAMNGLMANAAVGNLPPEQLAVLSYGAADALLFIERREHERDMTVAKLMAAAIWPMPGANPKQAPPPQQAPATATDEEIAVLKAQEAVMIASRNGA